MVFGLIFGTPLSLPSVPGVGNVAFYRETAFAVAVTVMEIEAMRFWGKDFRKSAVPSPSPGTLIPYFCRSLRDAVEESIKSVIM